MCYRKRAYTLVPPCQEAISPVKCVAAKRTEKHNTKRKNRCSTFNINVLGLYANWVARLQQSMIKLLVQRVCVWGRFHITLSFYTWFRCARYNWGRFVLAMEVFMVSLTVRILCTDDLKYIYYFQLGEPKYVTRRIAHVGLY